MRRDVRLAVLASAVIGLSAILASGSSRHTAAADGGCTNASLRGAYGFADQGQAFDASGTEVAEIAAAGRIVFDGNGGLTGTEWESLDGVITTIPFIGTYVVQPDCTGRTHIHDGMTADLRFMIVEGGQEANYFVTDPGVVAEGQIVKVQLGQCSNATLRGAYSFAASGSVFGTSGEAGDLTAFARLVLDGHGSSTESSNSSFNGAQVEDTQAGTYSVNSDCTGSATSTHTSGPLTGQVDHVNFVIVEGGTEVKFIVTNPGAVFTGTADKQPLEDD
jgi:hypothetical protein